MVLTADLVGALVFAWTAAQSSAFDPDILDVMTAIGSEAMHTPFGTTLLRGIFAGRLIALKVWMMPVAHSSRVAIIIIVTYVVALGRFPHIVAGSVEVLFLTM